MQRIKYTNKEGQPYDLVLKILKKKSKEIIVENPEDGKVYSIPRRAVESITEVKSSDKIESAD